MRCRPTGSFKNHAAASTTKKTWAKDSVIAVVNGRTATAQILVESATNAPSNLTPCRHGCFVFRLWGKSAEMDGSDEENTTICRKNNICKTWYSVTANLAMAATVANKPVARSAHKIP